ncbi:hypothetical protein [Nocardioides endophyticus]|uniref:hypothetical protein n=1 Tax=Nocardioides endophyticus TaxID=1353775 RepID=UPI0031EF3185
MPYDDSWEPAGGPPELVGLHEHCLKTYADRVPAARIPVERDRWLGLPTTLVSHPDAELGRMLWPELLAVLSG